jgi:NADH-quinone oxidoreductase subunit I
MAMLLDIASGFLSTVKGMMVTGRELFRKPITVRYPYEKREIPTRFRGMVVNDATRCNACTRCVRVCPVDCIETKGIGKGKERKAEYWTIDYSKCCWCQLCVEACPEGSLIMSHDYETVFTRRDQMKRDFIADPIVPLDEFDPRVREPREHEDEHERDVA